MVNNEYGKDLDYAETFQITDDNSADWAIRQIQEDVTERDRLIKIAENRIEELENEIDSLTAYYNNKSSYLKSCLFEYFKTVKHKETKTQESYKLLSGSLVLKKAKNKIVKDDDVLLQYFVDNGMNDFIKVKKSPAWAEYKKRLEIVGDNVIDIETGEIVDAVSIEESLPEFNVKF